MTAHDWYLENRVAFATRTLEPEDKATYTSHLSRCDECRDAVAQLERELAWLPMGVPPVAPRPGATQRLLEGILRRPRASWWRWAVPAAAAATLALSLGGWTKARREVAQLRMVLQVREGRLVAVADSLSAIIGAERVLQKTIAGPGYEGGLLIFYDRDTQRWNVVLHDLPAAGRGQAYRLWFVTRRGILPGPELLASPSRPTFVALPIPDGLVDVMGAVLTVGPARALPNARASVELAHLTF